MIHMLSIKEVVERTGICRTVIYELITAGEFPRGVPLTKKTVMWPERNTHF